MEKKALGRGLSALISSGRSVEDVLKKEIPLEPKTAARDEKGVIFVETKKLIPNRFQPRVQFDEEQLRELVASIKEKGVLAPILARRHGEGYEIIAGERRFRAAVELKLSHVPVVIRDASDEEALVLSIVENIQREELNPMEEAHAFDRLSKEFSFTQENIAKAVSKDRSTVANILRLLNLPPEVQKAISSGKLSFGHGKALLGLENVAQQIRLTQLVLSNSLSVRELENHITAIKPASSKKKKGAKEKDPYIVDLEGQLQRILGTKVRIFAFKKRGRIQIEYYSQDDRERILKLLKGK
ncbi:MAG: ParB/RepB/Spo0J family partition protein [Candidatus Omnitrophica bacterium]|nr:ParB/RepB/Spo0J family partition protein [Candidatus Omnitrophota bacterium]MDD5573706.1 ParB/RepB/Spo0J family partition protein [Candidatus Omnitrophota bacterium]